MSDDFDPSTWTDRKRHSFLSRALVEFLATVPTERLIYLDSTNVEEIQRRTEKAQRVSDVMDAVADAPKDDQ